MSYSNNITKLLKIEEPVDTIDYEKTITREYYNKIYEKWEKFKQKTGPDLKIEETQLIVKNNFEKIPNLALLNRNKEKQPIEKIIDKYIQDVKVSLFKQQKYVDVPDETPVLPSPEQTPPLPPGPNPSPDSQYSPPYAPLSPAYNPNSPGYAPLSPGYNPDSPGYAPLSPGYNPDSPNSSQKYDSDVYKSLKIQIPQNFSVSSDSSQSNTLTQPLVPVENESILEVETKPAEDLKTEASNSNNNSNESKKIILSTGTNEEPSK